MAQKRLLLAGTLLLLTVDATFLEGPKFLT